MASLNIAQYSGLCTILYSCQFKCCFLGQHAIFTGNVQPFWVTIQRYYPRGVHEEKLAGGVWSASQNPYPTYVPVKSKLQHPQIGRAHV